MATVISNPPYNMKWEYPFFAASQSRFDLGLPPENNANWAFVETALNELDHAVFLMPKGLLSSSNKNEKLIVENVIKTSWLKAIIALPERMFESTSIPTCLLVFDKLNDSHNVLMIDLADKATEETRLQNGQFGQAATNRTYKKTINVLGQEVIDQTVNLLKQPENIAGLSQIVTQDEIAKNDYCLTPTRYFKVEHEKAKHRDYKDIVNDLNHIIKLKNQLKITINNKAAKDLGVYELVQQFKESQKNSREIAKNIKEDNKLDLIEEKMVTTTNSKVLKIEVQDWDEIPILFAQIIKEWSQMIYALNLEENRFLKEYKEALLDDLF